MDPLRSSTLLAGMGDALKSPTIVPGSSTMLPIVMTGVLAVISSVSVGVSLGRHQMASGMVAAVVFTYLLLHVPFYRLAYLEFSSSTSRTMIYVIFAAISAWLVILTIVAGTSKPLKCTKEGFAYDEKDPDHHSM